MGPVQPVPLFRVVQARGESMKSKLLLALLPAVCLCWQTNTIHAQRSSSTAAIPVVTGRIAGVLKDQSGAVVPGAKIELKSLAGRFNRSAGTDQQGRFVFSEVPVGRYQVTVTASGFDIAVLHDLTVTAGAETAANVTLKIAPVHAIVEVSGSPECSAWPTVAATCAKCLIVSLIWRSRTRRSVTTITESKTFFPSFSMSMNWCAAHSMELLLPLPADCG